MELPSLIESLLFVYGEPLTLKKLREITGRNEEEIQKAVDTLRNAYQNRGLFLLEHEGSYQLGSHPEAATYVEKLVKSDLGEELSRAALETIAIVAYKGPLTRADIEYVRGVNSSFTLRNLLMRGLVERIENPKDARSYLYRVSFDFLKYLGLTRIEELPQFEEFKKEKIEVFEENAQS